jgi:hypothetical protein
MKNGAILPDLQSCVPCEDVRCEFNGMQTLVGVVHVIPASRSRSITFGSVSGRAGAAAPEDSGKNRGL